MLREPTIEKLHTLRLRVMVAAWLEQDKSPDTLALPFDDRLAMLVERNKTRDPRSTSLRSDHERGPSVHDAAVWVFTMPGIRR